MLLIANELRRYPVAGANVSFEAPGVQYSIGMNAIPWRGQSHIYGQGSKLGQSAKRYPVVMVCPRIVA